MTAYELFQDVIVGGAVVCSAVYAIGRLAPGLRRRIGVAMTAPRYPRWLNSVGLKLAGPSAGCGAGCGTCNSCGPTAAKSDPARVPGVKQR